MLSHAGYFPAILDEFYPVMTVASNPPQGKIHRKRPVRLAKVTLREEANEKERKRWMQIAREGGNTC